jgi:hypothetical protein
MFKNRKLEVRLVKDDARDSNTAATVQEPKPDYVAIADEATRRIGTKLLVGAAVLLFTTAVVAVLANAADTALQNALTTE